jgi:hypothetical protein
MLLKASSQREAVNGMTKHRRRAMVPYGHGWRIHLRSRAVQTDISNFALPGGNAS